jgi:crotonobetainyl-CoA:carnitine CoA-transferase CaiB-like acyl-CoA transferase
MRPLQNVRILDLSRLLPGPYCTRLLADMGAEVIKIEEPGRGDYIRSLPPFHNGVSVAFELLNRGKKSIALNLETKPGQEVFHKLVAKADVVLESFRPGTTSKLGCDFETVRKLNSRIVYCSLTAFGQTGPYRNLPAHDINCLGLSGFLSLNGKDEPTVPAVQVGDLAGGMLAALTITTALFAREQRKEAQYIDASMLDALLSWLTIPLALHLGGSVGILAGAVPFYRLYQTRDSKFMAVGAIELQFWEELCRTLQRPDLIPDQYADEPRRSQVIEAIQSVFSTKTSEEWFRLVRERQLPVTPLLSLDEVLNDAQAHERQMVLRKGETHPQITYVGNPCKITNLDPLELIESPRLGQHSAELLQEIGYANSEIKSLLDAGVIEHNV